MNRRPFRVDRWLKAGAVLLALAVLATAPFIAPGEGRSVPSHSPDIPTALDEPCLLPAPVMRREHPDLLEDERTRAVRLGVRDADRSLQRCVSCHVIPDAAGQPVPYSDDRHFCRACHLQVAVAPDCFTCHRSTPAVTDVGFNR